MGSFVKFLTRD